MSIIDTLITDRTNADVQRWASLKSKGWSGMTDDEKAEWAAGMKGAYNYTDLNRVTEAMDYINGRLVSYGYSTTYHTIEIEEGRTEWQEADVPTESLMNGYISNVAALRSVLEVWATTPPTPDDMEGLTYQEANNIEQILVDVEAVINQVVAAMARSNSFAFWSGNRPFPTAESNLGRTWNEFDAMEFKWSDLDNANWYIWAYGDPREAT